MADQNDTPETPGVPPVPPAPGADSVPPVEPTPAAAEPTAAPGAEQPNPYAQPAPAYDPYAAQQPYQAAPAYAAPGYGYAPQPPKGLSITSMILGIVGVLLAFCYGSGFLVGLGAVITGHMATKRQPHAKPFWLTGIITGYAAIGIGLIWAIILVVAFLALGSATWMYSY